ncbi:RHS repeat-associated core domain-containing protein [Undibacterium flavidum]|uniref:DUF4329 domain-containing protein n=1 Tax=Undibacterium flavidum TaxID=2762297 RepID=A0ABR6YEH7_9BURK|nr:RHS repeat-associated core domain-containing protein [Undibacterium flavidum]MBC3874907.1 DUF4329 domain-containing protein [Undibacterium flavidum]
MKQSMLMKTKRSIKSILTMLQLLVLLLTVSLGLSSHAQTGSLTITRTPSTMIAGQPFTITWSSTEPTAVATKYSCVSPAGGFAGSASLSVSGSSNGTADPNWVWKDSTCTWTVVNAAGTILASRTDIMKTVPAPVNGVTYIHTDGLGSPVAKSDANGNLIATSRTRYEPYGMAVAGTATPTIGFTGHVNDADTGLTYMQQRYYDPVAGRFLSTDPVLTDVNTAASFNRYTYALNNPYKYIDPDGRDAGDPFKTARAAAIDVIKSINPTSKSKNIEHAGLIYKDKDGSFKATEPKAGTTQHSDPFKSPAPKNTTIIGGYHTHGEYSLKDKDTGKITATADPKRDNVGSDKFLDNDKVFIRQQNPNFIGYLGTPGGKIFEYDPSKGKPDTVIYSPQTEK